MMQLGIFEQDLKIPGLKYIPEYITHEQELEFLQIIDTKPWITELK